MMIASNRLNSEVRSQESEVRMNFLKNLSPDAISSSFLSLSTTHNFLFHIQIPREVFSI